MYSVAVSLKTHKMLWGRAASRCSIADCRRLLYSEATESESESLIGEACHIVAESPQGPRGDSYLADDQRDEYQNLILLCAVHHKVVDDQPGKYSVQYLKEIKKGHEGWVMQSLSEYDPLEQKNSERYASYVDEWISRVDLENWRAWTSYLLAPEPRIDQNRLTHLAATRDWLHSRVWPDSHPRLRGALTNFRNVLNDFLLVFRTHAQPFGEDSYMTEAFYRIREWDPARYGKLLQRYEEHVDLVGDLVLELTRAANYVCDQVRLNLFGGFRLREGVALVERGPNSDLQWQILRVEYQIAERSDCPYPGLTTFKSVRRSRDYCVGTPEQPA
jgi:hypothetical protein